MLQNSIAVALLLAVCAILTSAKPWRFQGRKRWASLALLAAGLGALVWVFPRAGIDFDTAKQLNLLIALSAVGLLAWRWAVPVASASRFSLLVATALFALLNYCHFFAFHGQRSFVHLHDVAHYFLGSKYFGELRYDGLYTAMVRAEAELYRNQFRASEARDLVTYQLVHTGSLLAASERVKGRFSPARWHEFQQDVKYFRERLEPDHYALLLRDHGFNATPFWALVGGTLAHAVGQANDRSLLLLSLLDPLLLLGLFVAIGWVFGAPTALFAVIYFSLAFGATFGWTGGAFFRYGWLFGVVLSVSCIKRQRPVWAGAFLAWATLLRIFPAAFAVPLLLRAVWDVKEHGAITPPRWRFLMSFAVFGLFFFVVTALLPDGLSSWHGFRVNTERQIENISPNVIGVTQLMFQGAGSAALVTQEELATIGEQRQQVYHWQLATVFLATLIFLAIASRRLRDSEAAVAGILLLFTGLNLAAYYYVFLLLLILVNRASAPRLLLIFLGEAILYAARLFEVREAQLFIFRNWLILGLLVALYWQAVGGWVAQPQRTQAVLGRADSETELAKRIPGNHAW